MIVAISRLVASCQARLCAIVEAPTPPLAPTTETTRPTGLALGPRNRLRNRRDEIDDAERPHQIFAHPARNELPVEHDVVDLAEHDDLGARVAILREFVKLLEQQISRPPCASRMMTLGVGALR